MACRQGAQSLQTVDLSSTSGGSLVLPGGSLSLFINYQYTVPTVDTAKAFLETLDTDISG